MALLEESVEVKHSQIPKSGKGLFAKKFIPKGAVIVEYKGEITTWKKVDFDEGRNGYIYYVKKKHVIDASKNTEYLARYANDAKGLKRKKGLKNNAAYIEKGKKVFIQAKKDIEPGEEILVGYGKEYWDTIKHNLKIDKKEKRKKKKEKKK